MLAELVFPSIDELVIYTPFFGEGTLYAFNKIGLICVLSMVCTLLIFLIGGRKKALVPRGMQNVAEISIDFIKNQIIAPTMPHGEGMAWLPYFTTIFFFIFFCNITGIIPPLQMPASARMAIPLFLSVLTYVLFIVTGIVKQGPGYFKNALFPPGVPPALYILVTPIELLSTFLVRPFSLAVRLFANTLAGHILLVTFGALGTALLTADSFALKPIAILPAAMLLIMTGFELMVAFLQAYIFTILTAVYIGGAMHPEH